ncbi:DNA repair protein RadC [Candidatus Woesearchaeota archaeon]|nr:DNA repair protein RadC [Candidatus Woesearchaeota archaeon]
MKITDLAPENRPRERLQKEGAPALSSAELLAIILKSGTKKENVLEISNRLISKYGLHNLPHCSLPQLQQQYGIGPARASQLVALFELYTRMNCKNELKKISSAKDVAELYFPKIQSLQKEHFMAIYLDTKNNIVAEETITVGILNSSLIHPREVFHGAIKHLAHTVIVLHNHPSGDPEPSLEDLQVTKVLEKTGKIMGIPLLDHIILGKDSWWSWADSRKAF